MAKQTTTTTPVTDVEERRAKIAALQAQLTAEREALKAAAPKVSPLEREIARQSQATTRIDHLLTKMLERRIKAGQDRDAAVTDIVHQCRALLDAHQ